MMNRYTKTISKVLGVLLFVTAAGAHANITIIRGVATPKYLSASANNTVNITWRIGTDVGHSAGASSSSASIVDTATSGVRAAPIGGSLSQGGSGPFVFSETIVISAVDVKTWLDMGTTRVVIHRVFTGGNTVLADIALPLTESGLSAARGTAAELDIRRLRIALDEKQSVVKLVEQNGALQPVLTVNYAGTGLLEGKWQVAEPGSTEGKPLYRTLSLVRQPLVKAQESQLKGPVLPTNRAGKYLVRFCVSPSDQTEILAGGDSACPLPALTVQTAYQVMANEKPVSDIAIKSPKQESVNNETPFAWAPVTDSAMYKLDVFEKQGEQQWFVTGILLPANQTETSLSELMQQKLKKGGLYGWQISAVNAEGKVIAQSKINIFSYQP